MQALQLTLQLTVAAMGIGMVIGLFFALLKLSPIRPLNAIANLYITVVRATPLIVQIFVLYFGFTEIIAFSQFWAASLALAFHNGAYIAEIFRGGIQSIEKGQTEAARSLGMSSSLAMRRIVLPQAFKRTVPPLGNQFIIGLKDSSLAAFIGMTEIFNYSRQMVSATYLELEFYILAAVYYLIIVLIFTWFVNKLEHRLSVSDH
ncbi:amino acid ABC transporter permease [Caldalkalibacillus salinus]|uniref:amino acid ABC transporter permease n=1 Tax=Caldalkalibacillus salinus TaxID=2803787 RepID=UPI0019232459|nr:amino acid ABC transporter permease [Caldalkalibacillus salinus]